jgi:two-component system, chemotaxis family, chemotaxis protein CheY
MLMAQILVIDNDADVRTLLEQMLKPVGHKVFLAADGKEGMKLHRAAPADLVITDLFMPNQEGLETIIELRKDFPEVRIIAMSGKDAASAMLRAARQLGANKVLQKPFFPLELLVAVEEVLRSGSWPVSK